MNRGQYKQIEVVTARLFELRHQSLVSEFSIFWVCKVKQTREIQNRYLLFTPSFTLLYPSPSLVSSLN